MEKMTLHIPPPLLKSALGALIVNLFFKIRASFDAQCNVEKATEFGDYARIIKRNV